MAKVYSFVKNGEVKSYTASDKEQEYLEKNFELTGVAPGKFITIYVEKYPDCSTKVALMNGFKDNLDSLTTVEKFANLKLDLDYKKVKANLSEATKKLDRDEDVIKQIIEEVREN